MNISKILSHFPRGTNSLNASADEQKSDIEKIRDKALEDLDRKVKETKLIKPLEGSFPRRPFHFPEPQITDPQVTATKEPTTTDE